MLHRLVLAALCGLVLVAGAHRVLAADPRVRVVDDFDDDVQNYLGGYRNAFHKMPSTASGSRVRNIFRGQGGRSLRIRATREADGFCGVWIHLFDMRRETPQYLDARQYACLSFWVKGLRGGERFTVKLADRHWLTKEDALSVGHVTDFLPGGVTTDWQEVRVRLPQDGRLECRELGAVILEFADHGAQTVYVDDLSFKTSNELPVPLSRPAILPPADSLNYPRALWLWSTATLLSDARQTTDLLRFCQQHRITQVWAQLDYELQRRDAGPSGAKPVEEPVVCTIRQQPALRAFLQAAHVRGIGVHALDGCPEFALRTHHATPLAVVQAVMQFNRVSPSDQRFDGIHFDNEPYLLLGWQLPERREQILREFLELNQKCQRLVSDASDMQFGVDIPFWWHAADGRMQGSEVDVTFQGRRMPAALHCIDMLDNVGIMDYRDVADGADGIIAHGRHLLAYADQLPRASNRGQSARVHIGIETFRNHPTPVWFLRGLPRAEMLERLRSAERLAGTSRCEGLRLRSLDDGRYLHIGVELSESDELGDNHDFDRARRALLQVAKQLAWTRSELATDTADDQVRAVGEAVGSMSEWSGFRPRHLSAGNGHVIAGFTVTNQMVSKITFADNSFADLHEQVEAAEEHFQRYRSYGGLAIHFYETFRDLAEERR